EGARAQDEREGARAQDEREGTRAQDEREGAAHWEQGFRRPRLQDWLVLALVVPSLLVVMSYEVKFLRYLVLVLPFMVLLGSSWLATAYMRARLHSAVLARAVMGVTALVIVATVFYGLAFAATYARDHPAVQASEWVNANAQPGVMLLTDNHWDEGFRDLGAFEVQQLPMYDADSFSKVEAVAGWTADADYIMAYSNRPWGSIARVPERYPYSAAYYQALFSGELGYELVQAFDRYPSLAGVTFAHDPFTRAGVERPDSLPGVDTGLLRLNLGYADENATNYDRPLVLVWENVDRLPVAELTRVMLAGEQLPTQTAMLPAADWDTQRAGGTWTELFQETGLNRVAPWLVWLVLVEAIFLVTLPLAVRLFRWLPDRGVVLARPLGLLLVAWLVWLGASVGVWSFSRAGIGLAIAVVAVASGAVFYRHRRSMLAHLRRHWRYVASVEVLFIAAYLAFVLIRAANPDLWHPWRGGEKPMDLAYLT
ncbi:MAG: DUF2298 domain-containing protein, partial [Dehalococcoidia bacterium]